jgi:hypothetical protein
MSRHDDDADLRRAFAALRESERQEPPPFARLWQSAGRRRRARPFLLAAAGAAAVAAALLAAWLLRPQAPVPARAAAVPSLSRWRPATDFLLRTPGRELLGEPPALGRALPIDLGPSSSSSPSLTERRSS